MPKREWKGCKSNGLRNWCFLDTRIDNHEFTMIVTASSSLYESQDEAGRWAVQSS